MEEELSLLNKVIETAIENNESNVEFKDCILDLEDARFLVETAKKQFQQPNKPIEFDDNSNARKVLIIEENAEDLGFATKERVIEKGDKYTLFKNP